MALWRLDPEHGKCAFCGESADNNTQFSVFYDRRITETEHLNPLPHCGVCGRHFCPRHGKIKKSSNPTGYWVRCEDHPCHVGWWTSDSFDVGEYELTHTWDVPPWTVQPRPTVLPPDEAPITPRGIMGRNFLGIEEVVNFYGVTFSPDELKALERVPFSEATLKECKDTHVLVAGCPMTVLDVRARALATKPNTFYLPEKDAWFAGQAFANEKVDLRWYLIKQSGVEKSGSKTFANQKLLLGPEEEVPRVCELLYAAVLRLLGDW